MQVFKTENRDLKAAKTTIKTVKKIRNLLRIGYLKKEKVRHVTLLNYQCNITLQCLKELAQAQIIKKSVILFRLIDDMM